MRLSPALPEGQPVGPSGPLQTGKDSPKPRAPPPPLRMTVSSAPTTPVCRPLPPNRFATARTATETALQSPATAPGPHLALRPHPAQHRTGPTTTTPPSHCQICPNQGSIRGRGGWGGGWDLKVCVSKMAQPDFPCCKICFPTMVTLVWGGGGPGEGEYPYGVRPF